MSDTIYSLPDPKTPFESPEAERAHFQHPRYQKDAAFRDVVAQKAALSLTGVAPTSQRTGTLRVGLGFESPVVELHGPERHTTSTAEYREGIDREQMIRAAEELDRKAAEFQQDQQRKAADIYNAESFVSPEHPRAIALSKKPFASQAEMVAAMSSSRYRNDERWRDHITARMALTGSL